MHEESGRLWKWGIAAAALMTAVFCCDVYLSLTHWSELLRIQPLWTILFRWGYVLAFLVVFWLGSLEMRGRWALIAGMMIGPITLVSELIGRRYWPAQHHLSGTIFHVAIGFAFSVACVYYAIKLRNEAEADSSLRSE